MSAWLTAASQPRRVDPEFHGEAMGVLKTECVDGNWVWFQNARAKWRRMNANGGATIEGVLGNDDDMKGDDMSDMSPGDCGQNSMISCC